MTDRQQHRAENRRQRALRRWQENAVAFRAANPKAAKRDFALMDAREMNQRWPGLTCDMMADWRDRRPNDGLLQTDAAAVTTTDHDECGLSTVLGRMELE